MRPGRRPVEDPIEQEARAELRKPPVLPVVPRPAAVKPRSDRKPERWR